jgi:predicted nucleotide-binding protein
MNNNLQNTLDIITRFIDEGKEMVRYKPSHITYVETSRAKPWKVEVEHFLINTFGERDYMVRIFVQDIRSDHSIDVALGVNTLERIKQQIKAGSRTVESKAINLITKSEKSHITTEKEIIAEKEVVHSKSSQNSNEIFIIHGHDHAIRDSVANYIHKLGLKPIILADEASGGKTLIEKLEGWKKVKYAIVLLTPDDSSGCYTEDKHLLKTRARQNVIFELGLFIGWLGRENVCPISNGVDELPSDYMGVVYLPFDKEGAWKLSLIRELGKAGFKIEPSKI